MKKCFVFCLALWLSAGNLLAQSEYARKIVDTLSAPAFWGRGYTKNGMANAAVFIASEMKHAGLQAAGNDGFFQRFDFSTNTFPGKMEVQIGRKKLVAGKDFIVAPNSRALKGNFKLSATKETGAYFNAAHNIFVRTSAKLTWSPSLSVDDGTQIILKDTFKGKSLQLKANIDQNFERKFEASNVCGMVKGTEQPDSFLVLTAHYDHLGGMGDNVYFPGANDNASGVALLLHLAKYYAKNPQKYSIVFIAFAAEEIGLKGSLYFAENPVIDLPKIKFLLNLDLMGNGEEGVTVVNATTHLDSYQRLVDWNDEKKIFKAVNWRDNAANSDHYPFTQKGVPAFFIYTLGGNKAYHDIYDVPETLPLTYFPDLEAMIKDFFGGF